MGQRYRRMGDQKLWPDLTLNEEFSKDRSLSQKLKMKICKLGDVCQQISLLKRITNGGLGPKLQLLGIFFCNFL